MRRLMWFTIGFAAVCALCVYLLPDKLLLPLALILLPAALIPALWRKAPAAALAILGAGVGLIWFILVQRFYLLPAKSLDAHKITADVTATSFSWDTGYGTAVDGEVTIDNRKYNIRLYMDEPVHLTPGDVVSGTFAMRYTAPGGAHDPTYHAGQRILLLGYQENTLGIRRSAEIELDYLGQYLSREIEDILKALFDRDVFPFVKALLLGDSTDLSYETDTALSVSGIRHIIAVSGLHVAILYTLLTTATFHKPLLTALIGIPVLFLFAATVGFTASVTRACLMVGLMMLAGVFRREYDSPTALSFAVLSMLLANPLTITSVGFQMSVGCVCGILLFQKPINGYFTDILGARNHRGIGGRLLRWLISSVSVTLSAVSLTTPMSALYFNTVSLIGIVTNLLTLWVITWIFIGAVLVLIVSIFAFPAARLMARCISWLARYVLLSARVLSKLPMAAVYTNSIYIVIWLVFVYILLAVFLNSRKKQPWPLFCYSVLGLCLALLCSWTEPRLDNVRLTALDVGQGQSLILQCGGKTYLIDCGGSNPDTVADLTAQTLLSQGIRRLDGIILTHGDLDHSGALNNLLTRVDADWIMLPVTTDPARYNELAENIDSRIIAVGQDLEIKLPDAKIHLFGPTYAAQSNENSLCLLFEGENCAILITGDRSRFGELLLLRRANLPQVDLLIAGHHGSKYSCSEELLQRVSPDTVIISVGRNNSYGHPAQETVQRLIDQGCQVFRTDLHGSILFRR